MIAFYEIRASLGQDRAALRRRLADHARCAECRARPSRVAAHVKQLTAELATLDALLDDPARLAERMASMNLHAGSA